LHVAVEAAVLAQWNTLFKILQHADEGVSKILIGNKADMAGKIQVTPEEGQDLARKYGIPFFLTSAKTNLNVSEAFMAAADECLKKPEPTRKHKDTVDPGSGGKKKGGCCTIM
jgi:Ras-related protein Rab-8A